MTTEIWREIQGADNKYLVSNLGNILSLRNNIILRQYDEPKRYSQIRLSLDGVPCTLKTHQLVARHFIPNPNNMTCINHIDGNKHNNNIANLEWCTIKENVAHAIKNKLMVPIGDRLRKAIVQYDMEGNKINEYISLQEAHRQGGFSVGCISQCCNGKYKAHKGYIWKFKNDK